ncbi:MAG: hypothetical protein P5702_04945 [Limnospira sp. PMC 1291.21]|uniref:hypothetical protein n=1 Tax=unclassified Limnospira TaxID=2642885 RepID=UPI0028E1815B|nr:MULTISPECIES: hypothetical protein [unclassified Limnospira]MDT9177083.1 hypothetical protein [Limnospira sp. PMC 1238.20]MDT9192300.1 hypothetical protein [Limnospira sp. PMC 1245.20]MDT9202664.1 hypothetical protein [Limnospira sp. PMC 1243.20]MDT9207602.1 hypothetical protein [Limnospira sp. PMC 1252.20]MDT9212956.1 hypothetical protein [Limnospira sp. PMC 1256.20]
MTILIANIGTSDLALKFYQPLKKIQRETSVSDEDLEQNYFLPVGFDRNEPNLKEAESQLSTGELLIWQNRYQLLKEQYYQTWKVNTFRELTQCLLGKYIETPQELHDCIRPGRLWGVVKEAVEASVRDIYIFVTDQFLEENGEKNKGADSDTVYLFEILQLWFDRELNNQINLHKVVIPKMISPIDQDGLLGEYYNFFKGLDPSEGILISVKGGTPQMQTALRVQAISSDIANQIYLEPQLSIQKLLQGEASSCRRVSYWRYQRVQKYQTVKKLLARWDFDGAREILTKWLETLETLERSGITEISESRHRLTVAVKALKMSIAYLNLDSYEADKQADSGLDILEVLCKNEQGFILNGEQNPFRLCKNYEPVLNLYTQCCLFWKLERIADFLGSMSAFYEEILHQTFEKLEAISYFDKTRNENDWVLKLDEIRGTQLGETFLKIEKKTNTSFPKIYQNQKQSNYKLQGRLSKRNFVKALILIKKGSSETLEGLIASLKSLDYWAEQRNFLIHGAKGISKQRMENLHSEDLENPGNWKIEKTVRVSCLHTEIIPQMSQIYCCFVELVSLSGFPNVQDYLEVNQETRDPIEPYYLYSEIKEWVGQILDHDQ